MAHNGAFVQLETEWSAYFNPWTRKLDMIFGQHSIAQQPIGGGGASISSDVFAEPTSVDSSSSMLLSVDALCAVESEIISILAEVYRDDAYKAYSRFLVYLTANTASH